MHRLGGALPARSLGEMQPFQTNVRKQPVSQPSSDSTPQSIARSWVIRLASGEATQNDIDTIHAWIRKNPENAMAFEEERRLWQELSAFRPALEAESARHVASSSSAAAFPDARRFPVRKVILSSLAMAAAVTLAVLAPDLTLRLRADHMTQHGEIATWALADGSRLVLDADSAVALHFTDRERRIELLRGRVWIEARHDQTRPLRVVTLGGVTEDVGTGFSVSRGDDRVDVGVTQGTVLVGTKSDPARLYLKAGQAAHYRPNSAPVRDADVDVEDLAAWRNGEIVIRHAPLAEALRTVARYRQGATYILADLHDAQPVDAVLRTDQPDDAIASLARAHALHLHRLPMGMMVITAGNRPE